MPRNFGKGAIPIEDLARKGDGPQRPGGSDCLQKHRSVLEVANDVYGLTPARCWKVKGTVSLRSKLRI